MKKEWSDFVKANSGYFQISRETDDMVHLNTREHGSIGDEEYGQEDADYARYIIKKVKEKYPKTRSRLYNIDEWVELELTYVPDEKEVPKKSFEDYKKELYKNINKEWKGKKHNGWEYLGMDLAGVIDWQKGDYTVKATPFWDKSKDTIAIDAIKYEDSILYVDEIQFEPTYDVEKDTDRYIKLIEKEFSKTTSGTFADGGEMAKRRSIESMKDLKVYSKEAYNSLIQLWAGLSRGLTSTAQRNLSKDMGYRFMLFTDGNNIEFKDTHSGDEFLWDGESWKRDNMAYGNYMADGGMIKLKDQYKLIDQSLSAPLRNGRGLLLLRKGDVIKITKLIADNNSNFLVANFEGDSILISKENLENGNKFEKTMKYGDYMADGGYMDDDEVIEEKIFDINDDEVSEDIYEFLVDYTPDDFELSEEDQYAIRLEDPERVIDFMNDALTDYEILTEYDDDQIGIKIIKKTKMENGGYMADGGMMNDEKMTLKLQKEFEGKDLFDDEIVDEYVVKQFDYSEDDDKIEKFIRMKKNKFYVVPFDNQDDSYYYILVPKDKMAKGGAISDIYVLGSNYEIRRPMNVDDDDLAKALKKYKVEMYFIDEEGYGDAFIKLIGEKDSIENLLKDSNVWDIDPNELNDLYLKIKIYKGKLDPKYNASRYMKQYYKDLYSDEDYARGGKLKSNPAKFRDKVKAISKKLVGTKVPKKYKKDYGATYDKQEANTAARRISGAKLAELKAKLAKKTKTKKK
jgi:hypothetical protein